eukprot:4066737-Pyramimonas_sp.AAC.1
MAGLAAADIVLLAGLVAVLLPLASGQRGVGLGVRAVGLASERYGVASELRGIPTTGEMGKVCVREAHRVRGTWRISTSRWRATVVYLTPKSSSCSVGMSRNPHERWTTWSS